MSSGPMLVLRSYLATNQHSLQVIMAKIKLPLNLLFLPCFGHFKVMWSRASKKTRRDWRTEHQLPVVKVRLEPLDKV